MSKELLRRLPLFAGLEESDLDRLYSTARRVSLAPGDVVVTEGDVADTAYLAVDGTFEVTKRSGDRDLIIARRGPGELIGEIALLENALRSATVRAATNAEILEISRDTFQELLRKCPSAAVAVLQTVAARLRNTELMLRQSEKMAALGTLSAGLAHELNNPAAAVQRSAAQLRAVMADLHTRAAVLATGQLTPHQLALVEGLLKELATRLAASAARNSLARGDAEASLQEWLEELGAEEAWELAPQIAAAGWDASDLRAVLRDLTAPQQVAVAGWLAAASSGYLLLEELGQGAARIAEIVSAVKSYSYLDRAPVQLLDVHEGLENTLIILRHKLRQGVDVVRQYDPDLPRIEAYGGELNQVWTNILDNAIDAMQGHGVIRIRTRAESDAGGALSVVVEITDNGPGIPPEVQEHIFDAFFTTKQPGSGTGLGLHISYNIVANQHRGNIAVQSRPGETTFTVTLPVRMSEL